MTRLCGYQPQYFPRLHYVARILNSDIYKISDSLQYVRRHAYPLPDGTSYNGPSYQAHTPIRTANGVLLLDIPVRHTGDVKERLINTVPIDYSKPWAEKHVAGIKLYYKKSPQGERLFPSLEAVLMKQYPSLADLTITTTLWALGILFELPEEKLSSLTIETVNAKLPHTDFRLSRIIQMHELGILGANKEAGESASDWIIESCRILGVDEYYHGGTAAAAYLDEDHITEAGIKLIEQNWHLTPYVQQFPKVAFMPNLSIIDLLMNVSPQEARSILHTTGE